MSDIVARLRDLHKQATVEHSHYYVGNCALDAAARIEQLEAALREIAGEANSTSALMLSELRDVARAALDQSSPPKAST